MCLALLTTGQGRETAHTHGMTTTAQVCGSGGTQHHERTGVQTRLPRDASACSGVHLCLATTRACASLHPESIKVKHRCVVRSSKENSLGSNRVAIT